MAIARLVFTNVPEVGALYNRFRRNTGSLYHYTRSEPVARSIAENGEFWITRADSFLDDKEVRYGTGVLLEALNESCYDVCREYMERLISSLGTALLECFVLSLTDKQKCQYMLREYGEWRVELSDSFPTNFYHLGRQSIALKDGGYELHFVPDIYEHVEGHVIYDRQVQISIAKDVINLAVKMHNHVCERDYVELFHLRKLLVSCIVMFKREEYAPESEYRYCLVRVPNDPNAPSFDSVRNGIGQMDGKQIVFTKIRFPVSNANSKVTLHSPDPSGSQYIDA